MVALAATHPLAALPEIDIATLEMEAFVVFPRAIAPEFYDTIIGACRAAAFEPVIGQVTPQIGSVVTLVAAELGASIGPVSIGQLQVTGVAYRPVAGTPPTAKMALVHRRGDTSVVVRNFIT